MFALVKAPIDRVAYAVRPLQSLPFFFFLFSCVRRRSDQKTTAKKRVVVEIATGKAGAAVWCTPLQAGHLSASEVHLCVDLILPLQWCASPCLKCVACCSVRG
jgi:hypothetical protein